MNCINLSIILFACVTSIVSNPIKPEPLINVDRDVRIDLYTLENPTTPQFLMINDTNSITSSYYDRKAPTRIFIHGFRSGKGFTNSLLDGYLIQGQHDVNMIGINWEKASITINYPGARKNVGIIGEYTAKFIDFMVENKFMKLSDLIVIGFSLGAHAAGFTGKNLQSGRLPKIVGLDPAGVLFSFNKPAERLNYTDAEYVETIQTSKLGFFDPIGSVSFYPNGGRVQPTCEWDATGSCSHSTVYKYYAQTVAFEGSFYGDLCSTQEDIKKETCNPNVQAAMGGEPGAMKQPAGMYYIRMVPDPDTK